MAVNVYLMPRVGTGTRQDPFRGKYWDNIVSGGFSVAQADYGLQPVFLVAVQDISGALNSTIAADATCITVPGLAQNVGAQLTAVTNALEALNIPAGWVTAGMSYGSVVRVVLIIFLLFQRLSGQGNGILLNGGITLDTRFNQLTVPVRNELLAMAQSFNFDTSSLSGASTLRAIFKALADQWPAISIPLGPLTL